ncbi:MAG: NADP-dependent oxidoreductase, partial [Bacillota bacterium]|nr:NADP-dependent oxidoreductase [Bacillota bacterium]
IVGQIAKIHGSRVIGISGSDEKNAYLVNELGFDGVINYKAVSDMEEELRKLCPDGIDVYFDNVGNELINILTKLINPFARIVLCGQISQYNGESPYIDPKIFGRITKNRAVMQGFLITGYDQKKCEAARSEIVQWIMEGKIKYTETILEGLNSAPKALIDLFHGKNIGKQLVRIGS